MTSQRSNPAIRRSVKFILPVIVLMAAWAIAQYFNANKPQAEKRPAPEQVLSVEATRLQPAEYPVSINSQGTVQATHENTLVPEVAGTIVWISPHFVVGGQFDKGQELLRIDAQDYEIALTQANANLAESEAQLLEQTALAERAQAEWKAMGRRGEPSALTLRKPQLAAATAVRDAAIAQVERAELDLQRTRIISPYAGKVSERAVNAGQFVARGSAVGQIYSISSVDVKLPINNRQLTYMQLPSQTIRPTVRLEATIGTTNHLWMGELIRVEGLDATTQQLNLIVQVSDPLQQGEVPLRVGQFVQAQIEGDVLNQVFVIPRSALREEREVLLIDDQQQIVRRPVVVAWSDDTYAAIEQGLDNGSLLITTPLSTVSEGTPVKATIDGVPPKASENKDKPARPEQRIN